MMNSISLTSRVSSKHFYLRLLAPGKFPLHAHYLTPCTTIKQLTTHSFPNTNPHSPSHSCILPSSAHFACPRQSRPPCTSSALSAVILPIFNFSSPGDPSFLQLYISRFSNQSSILRPFLFKFTIILILALSCLITPTNPWYVLPPHLHDGQSVEPGDESRQRRLSRSRRTDQQQMTLRIAQLSIDPLLTVS